MQHLPLVHLFDNNCDIEPDELVAVATNDEIQFDVRDVEIDRGRHYREIVAN